MSGVGAALVRMLIVDLRSLHEAEDEQRHRLNLILLFPGEAPRQTPRNA